MFGKCLKTGPHQEALRGPREGCGRPRNLPGPLAHSAVVLRTPPRLVLRLPLIPCLGPRSCLGAGCCWGVTQWGARTWSLPPGHRSSSLISHSPPHTSTAPHPLCGPPVHPKPFPTSEHVCSLCPPSTICQSPLTDFCRSQPNVTPRGLPWSPPHRRWALTLLGNTSRSLASCSELPCFTSMFGHWNQGCEGRLICPTHPLGSSI